MTLITNANYLCHSDNVFERLLFIVKTFVRYNVTRNVHIFFLNTLNSFSLLSKYENCWPYRLINFTSLLSAAVCQVRYVLILQIWETCLQNYCVYSSLSEHLRRNRTAGPAAFWCSESLPKSVTAINERRPTPSLSSFLPIIEHLRVNVHAYYTNSRVRANGALIFVRRSRGRRNVSPVRSQFPIAPICRHVSFAFMLNTSASADPRLPNFKIE